MKRNLVFAVLLIVISTQMVKSQSISRVEPLCWWVGLENRNLQLMVYGKNIGNAEVKIDYPSVTLIKVNRVTNRNYLFLDLTIEKAAHAGSFDINFVFDNKNSLKYTYTLLQRNENSSLRNGFSSKDVVYLLMPDRFSNGNPSNDSIEGYKDKLKRNHQFGRHGGDIQGVINHLDYFNDLGITTLWLTPVLENNLPNSSYHGYAITDYYKVDPRHGSNELYRLMIEKAHQKGLKVIMDMVFNHCGIGHWWMNDLPSEDWLNQWPEYTNSNFRAASLSDPYASDYDKTRMTKGWFVKSMPDLNQDNPFVARYLTQNSIWWIEYADLDGIRMDTHPYSEKAFISGWAKEVMTQYPNFNIVGEVWMNDTPQCAYWQKDALNKDGFNSNLPTVMDFPLMFTLQKVFNEEPSWDKSAIRLYDHLTKDFLYANPSNILIFADNHDESRFLSKTDSIANLKMAMALLLTTRGIPQIYYGTEILMKGQKSDGDGKLRLDFPGGWTDDKRNAFTSEGRTKKENDTWNYLQTIMKWRKVSDVIHTGKLKQFVPEENIYVYFRYNSSKTVMVILNINKTEKSLKTNRFIEATIGFTLGHDIITGKDFDIQNEINLSPNSAVILELKP
jgi:neopullulanase